MTVRLIATAVIAALLLTGTVLAVTNSEVFAAPATKTATDVPQEDAVQIALDHAGVDPQQVTALHTEADKDRRGVKWEVEFRCEDYEYEYEISGTTGEILKKEKEFDPKPQAPANIGRQAAIDAALAHAGLTADRVRKLECDFDEDDGRWKYEVSFVFDGMEYEYELLAETGQIREFDKEPID